ncbi:MAG TPA: peroxidase family protein [Tabrizicola sp.]|nr:peroxidase family protein [Tabrizicola sp.]
MPITSTHYLMDLAPAGGSGRSRYTYLFPDLADEPLAGCFSGTTPAQTCERLKAFEIASRAPLTGLPILQMRLPAAYTYFGQFVNHDISAPAGDVVQGRQTAPLGVIGTVDPPGLDRTHRADRTVILANLVNEHPAPLTLCSLYGEGPDSEDPDTRALYEPDRKRFRLGLTRCEPDQHFLNLNIEPKTVHHDTGARDIPRAEGRALIADRRNDENLVVSQLHLAMMLFHNKAVAALEPTIGDPIDCFRAARQLVTLHYHWLVLHDYLPRLLSLSTLALPLESFPSRLSHRGEVPMEFTTAAFRFGHSMVGQAYDFNANFGVGGRIRNRGATLEELFEFTTHQNMQTAEVETLALPDHWVIDWDRMTGAPARRPTATNSGLGGAERIDMIFARDMLNLVGDSKVAVHGSILFRNLMRSYHRRIPFGQKLADACQIPKLTQDEIRAALPSGLQAAAEHAGFLEETPAWLYFLCEASTREGGQRVGPTASHIIAETIVGLLRLEPASILNQSGGSWHPRHSPLRARGGQSLTTLRKFLRFAVEGTAVPVSP